MSCFVYRYIDAATEIIKYVGICCAHSSIQTRVDAHRNSDDWYNSCNWRIEYAAVSNKSEAEAFESHLIALWETDKWFNKQKSGWGINKYLPTDVLEWIEWREDVRTKRKICLPQSRTVKDISGMRFGKLTALHRSSNYISPSGIQSSRWECQCDCGNVKIVNSSSLLSGNTVSCGCVRENMHKENLVGQVFGELTVLNIAYKDRHKKTYYECRCSCGNTIVVRASNLKSGNTKSCGHLRKSA